MRVCILEEFTRLGGGQVYALQMARALTELGHSVEFVVTGDIKVDPKYPVRHVDVGFKASYDPASLLINYINHRRLRRLLGRYVDDCDLVINNHPNYIPYNKGPIVLHGLSFVDFIIDENGNIRNQLLFWVLSRIYRMYDGSYMIYNSRYTMNLAKKLLPKIGIEPRLEYVLSPHYTISTDSIPEKEDYVLTLGRLEWSKGYRELIKIAPRIGKRIIVAGRADARESREVIRVLRGVKNIDVMPDIDEKTKEELYKHASIYLHLKLNEHFGIAVLDAIATATIPIVPRTGGPWTDIVEEGKYGLGYTNTEEIPQLINKAEETINRERVFEGRERYSPENFRRRLMKALSMAIHSEDAE
ncbi:glycosyltransferase family 4 protein [Vulcanisaeta souniana]|uniref:Glycosyl transferase n=1 Tax=Vulcanisaeta souniana JCM 11219 TaxID=1293586 RepID=A0A830DZC8_9CREN|nr:glycosyltransferase family 4 protein [Vulcanisaeta souniana]BDR91647.1 glycosyl transferase [Vulcanisaeta souniana JCM 11219]GGI71642.1 glycosyl transferase [Vulcanisaeta souniana JCM 11219]